jgi:hypothetical protein
MFSYPPSLISLAGDNHSHWIHGLVLNLGKILNLNYLQVFSMLPGFSSELMPKGHEKESQAKIKRYMMMMDSMTDAGKVWWQVFPLIYYLWSNVA